MKNFIITIKNDKHEVFQGTAQEFRNKFLEHEKVYTELSIIETARTWAENANWDFKVEWIH